MTVEINSVRTVLELKYDKAKVHGSTVSVEAGHDQAEVRGGDNDALINVTVPHGYKGSIPIVVRGSKGGEDRGTVEVE